MDKRFDYSYIKNKEEKRIFENFEKDYLKRELSILTIENGYILPHKDSNSSHTWMGLGGVLDDKKEFIRLSGIEGFSENEGHLVFGGSYEFDECETIEEEVLYMGAFQPHWGHFLLEYISRLYYFNECNRDIKVAYCGFACEPDSMSGNYLELLQLIGIRKEQLIDVRKPLKCKKIIVPEQGFLRDKYFSNEYKLMIDRIVDVVLSEHDGRKDNINLYFTRTNFVKTNVAVKDKERGEQMVKEAFESNGYTCIAPETLSFKEQVLFVNSADTFVVPIGGASMNALFTRENAKCVFLKKAYLPNIPADMHIISQMKRLRYATFVDIYYKPYKLLPLSYGQGPHFLSMTKQMKLYFKNNGLEYRIKFSDLLCNVKNFLWITTERVYYSPAIRKVYKCFKKIIRK